MSTELYDDITAIVEDEKDSTIMVINDSYDYYDYYDTELITWEEMISPYFKLKEDLGIEEDITIIKKFCESFNESWFNNQNPFPSMDGIICLSKNDFSSTEWGITNESTWKKFYTELGIDDTKYEIYNGKSADMIFQNAIKLDANENNFEKKLTINDVEVQNERTIVYIVPPQYASFKFKTQNDFFQTVKLDTDKKGQYVDVYGSGTFLIDYIAEKRWLYISFYSGLDGKNGDKKGQTLIDHDITLIPGSDAYNTIPYGQQEKNLLRYNSKGLWKLFDITLLLNFGGLEKYILDNHDIKKIRLTCLHDINTINFDNLEDETIKWDSVILPIDFIISNNNNVNNENLFTLFTLKLMTYIENKTYIYLKLEFLDDADNPIELVNSGLIGNATLIDNNNNLTIAYGIKYNKYISYPLPLNYNNNKTLIYNYKLNFNLNETTLKININNWKNMGKVTLFTIDEEGFYTIDTSKLEVAWEKYYNTSIANCYIVDVEKEEITSTPVWTQGNSIQIGDLNQYSSYENLRIYIPMYNTYGSIKHLLYIPTQILGGNISTSSNEVQNIYLEIEDGVPIICSMEGKIDYKGWGNSDKPQIYNQFNKNANSDILTLKMTLDSFDNSDVVFTVESNGKTLQYVSGGIYNPTEFFLADVNKSNIDGKYDIVIRKEESY